ncbi:hypothetical protein B0T16DRAFT_454814 [Cercophora newfieldiana]|uniref:Uncharacterized protein n=1 Tax=Cercophora newfieldiana TaxID=92897 RepID=A0AA40CX62_9PEZI|nr:hypothetical protein B0T16DRAFT_454814 [Cercophora newfieldiana]
MAEIVGLISAIAAIAGASVKIARAVSSACDDFGAATSSVKAIADDTRFVTTILRQIHSRISTGQTYLNDEALTLSLFLNTLQLADGFTVEELKEEILDSISKTKHTKSNFLNAEKIDQAAAKAYEGGEDDEKCEVNSSMDPSDEDPCLTVGENTSQTTLADFQLQTLSQSEFDVIRTISDDTFMKIAAHITLQRTVTTFALVAINEPPEETAIPMKAPNMKAAESFIPTSASNLSEPPRSEEALKPASPVGVAATERTDGKPEDTESVFTATSGTFSRETSPDRNTTGAAGDKPETTPKEGARSDDRKRGRNSLTKREPPPPIPPPPPNVVKLNPPNPTPATQAPPGQAPPGAPGANVAPPVYHGMPPGYGQAPPNHGYYPGYNPFTPYPFQPPHGYQALPPAPTRPDPEKEQMRLQLEAVKRAQAKVEEDERFREREMRIRRDAEESFHSRMEAMRRAQEEAIAEIERAKLEAERTAREKLEQELRAQERRRNEIEEARRQGEREVREEFEAERRAEREWREAEQAKEEQRRKEIEESWRKAEAAKKRSFGARLLGRADSSGSK